jgi:hypothetical protein
MLYGAGPDSGESPQGKGYDINRKLARLSALKSERSTWDTHWKDIAQYQFPRAGRFISSETNQGSKKNGLIYDNTAIFAVRTLAAGMMSGVTSPARPWFRLGLPDKELMEFGPVKQWLHDAAELMRAVFAASNTYNSLHACYEELGAFGTWADVVLPDFDNVIHHYPLTVGEYYLGHNHKGQVDTLAREFKMTVAQLVEQFGKDACSPTVRNLWDKGAYDQWIDVVHMIQPRRDREYGKRDAKNMAFESCYFEPGREAQNQYLSESGFRRFPALCPRWTVTGNDIYGRSPGMEALGDTKQLQYEQQRKAQAIEYQVNPPLQVPTAYKASAQSRLPGGVMYVDAMSPGGGVRSAFEVNLRLDFMLDSIRDTRDRIRQAYYADLFLMLAQQPANGRMTATEVAERHEEKLLMLGPVLERLHNELLSPLVDLTFDRCLEAGILPPAPAEIAGTELDIEFISVLAQAQRAVAVNGMERLLTTAVSLAPVKPEILDKINFDQVIDDMGNAFGVNPAIVVPDAQAAEVRAARAQAMQAQASAATAPQVVESAKTASEINTDQLRDVMGMLQGYSSPSPAMVE